MASVFLSLSAGKGGLLWFTSHIPSWLVQYQTILTCMPQLFPRKMPDTHPHNASKRAAHRRFSFESRPRSWPQHWEIFVSLSRRSLQLSYKSLRDFCESSRDLAIQLTRLKPLLAHLDAIDPLYD